MVNRFLLSWVVNFLGLWAAARLFSSIDYQSQLWVLLIASLIFGIVNAIVRPVVVILSLPAIVVTLGIFTLVVNVLMLYLTSLIFPKLEINSIAAAIGAVVIIWLVNYVFNDILMPDKENV
jgi:putative membrane protein